MKLKDKQKLEDEDATLSQNDRVFLGQG